LADVAEIRLVAFLDPLPQGLLGVRLLPAPVYSQAATPSAQTSGSQSGA
jgi:hypothetical protein